MCDPITLGTLAIGAAGTAAKSIGSANAQKQQQREYESWIAQQNKNRQLENQRQEAQRGQAEIAQQKGVQDISAENQKATQEAEAARLNAALNEETQTNTPQPDAPASIADARLTGQQSGGEVFQSDLAKKISDATASAKQRIGALATAQSYGGSQGGLGTVNPINQARAGSGIDLANEKRRGSMGAYGVEQAVSPIDIEYSNPIADIASSFMGVGAQRLGSMFADSLGAVGGGLGGAMKAQQGPLVSGKTLDTVMKPKTGFNWSFFS